LNRFIEKEFASNLAIPPGSKNLLVCQTNNQN
jgi:hypothetical protein